jgi:hypothetical protein
MLDEGETIIAPATNFWIREASGSVGHMANAGRVAVAVTDRRLLCFKVLNLGRKSDVLSYELPLDGVRHVTRRGRLTEIEVDGGSLTVRGVGRSSRTRQRIFDALNAETALPEELESLDRQIEETWRSFPDFPGIHMAVRRITRHSRELVVRDGEILCVLRGAGRDLVVGNCIFVARRRGKIFGIFDTAIPPYEVIDASSGELVLEVESRNYDSKASGIARSSSHRYTFPVQHRRRLPKSRCAVMSAVDETGRTVALFRRIRIPGQLWRQVEIAVTPGEVLSNELIVLLITTARFLATFFEHPGGG